MSSGVPTMTRTRSRHGLRAALGAPTHVVAQQTWTLRSGGWMARATRPTTMWRAPGTSQATPSFLIVHRAILLQRHPAAASW